MSNLKKILVVDDEELLRNLFGIFLKTGGYEVSTAKNGFDALAVLIADKENIGLVVTDVDMPTMNGYQLVERTRERKWDIPFIVMSGDLTQERKEKFSELEVKEFLYKPIRKEDLLNAVGRAYRG